MKQRIKFRSAELYPARIEEIDKEEDAFYYDKDLEQALSDEKNRSINYDRYLDSIKGNNMTLTKNEQKDEACKAYYAITDLAVKTYRETVNLTEKTRDEIIKSIWQDFCARIKEINKQVNKKIK